MREGHVHSDHEGQGKDPERDIYCDLQRENYRERSIERDLQKYPQVDLQRKNYTEKHPERESLRGKICADSRPAMADS